jgi:hypothetical protein
LSLFPIAASKSLADARIACVFFLALGKTFGAKCTIYFHTVPNGKMIFSGSGISDCTAFAVD